MKKFGYLFLIPAIALSGCDKSDPILPGDRTSIFENEELQFSDKKITDLPANSIKNENNNCNFTLDNKNNIWRGKTKIHSGFATNDFVDTIKKPICDNGYVFAGLTTGDLIKINPITKKTVWSAQIYSDSNITGGASILDIVAPIVILDKYVYVAGLGNAICKISTSSGNKIWCNPISISDEFIVTKNVTFAKDINNTLYAINNANGKIHWMIDTDSDDKISYSDYKIMIDGDEYDAYTGSQL